MSDADPYVLTKLSEHISQHLNKSLDQAVDNLSLRLQDTAKDAIADTREINTIIEQAVREAVEKAVEKSVVTEVESSATESEFKFPPSRNSNFVGRSSTLAKLLSLWKPDQKSRLAVVGLGGIGCVIPLSLAFSMKLTAVGKPSLLLSLCTKLENPHQHRYIGLAQKTCWHLLLMEMNHWRTGYDQVETPQACWSLMQERTSIS